MQEMSLKIGASDLLTVESLIKLRLVKVSCRTTWPRIITQLFLIL